MLSQRGGGVPKHTLTPHDGVWPVCTFIQDSVALCSPRSTVMRRPGGNSTPPVLMMRFGGISLYDLLLLSFDQFRIPTLEEKTLNYSLVILCDRVVLMLFSFIVSLEHFTRRPYNKSGAIYLIKVHQTSVTVI